MFDLRITDLKDAPTVALGWATKTVSLVDSSGIANPFFGEGHQVFVFDDLHSEKEECHRPGMQHAPKMKDIQNVLAFTERFTDEDKVLIHCHGGISRSTAVSILVLIQHGMVIPEAVDKVLDIRPVAWPNALIIRLGDVALEQDGMLIAFMNEWWEANLGKITWD
jgi:predicted protein tyrosine phosphatase